MELAEFQVSIWIFVINDFHEKMTNWKYSWKKKDFKTWNYNLIVVLFAKNMNIFFHQHNHYSPTFIIILIIIKSKWWWWWWKPDFRSWRGSQRDKVSHTLIMTQKMCHKCYHHHHFFWLYYLPHTIFCLFVTRYYLSVSNCENFFILLLSVLS